MQNKANSLNVQTNATNCLTGAYEKIRFCSRGKNKAKQSRFIMSGYIFAPFVAKQRLILCVPCGFEKPG